MTTTLVLGGARSGKSAFGEGLVPSEKSAGQPVTYVATARPWPGDEDFAQRISRHVGRRPSWWRTEDTVDLIEVLRDPPAGHIIVDDLGTWLTHQLDQMQAWDAPRGTVAPRIQALLEALSCARLAFRCPDAGPARQLVLISPEVGMGVIPEQRAGRLFRDEIGALNASVAELADRVELIVAGLPLRLKPSPRPAAPTGAGPLGPTSPDLPS